MEQKIAALRHASEGPDELIFGVVAPLGTDLRETVTAIEEGLKLVGYASRVIRLSKLLESWSLGVELAAAPEDARLRSFMAAGTKAREVFGHGDILALSAVSQINESRPENGSAIPKTAHVLLTLKHPEEVRTLRRIYGPGFYLIGVSSSKGDRTRHLVGHEHIEPRIAEDLIRLDEEELQPNEQPSEFGQKTRDTFQLADVFVRAGDRAQIGRFLDLVFGDPFQTPTPEEHAMFMAYASSLRSADLSRQVGAVILSERGDLIATGANDVAAPGGGLYWPGEGDMRDFKLGKDINEQRRNEFVLDVMRRVSPGSGETEKALLERGRKLLQGSPIFDITEFGRAVHAEMEALMASVRSGTSPRRGTLVCTTFPCHNCAKHVVAAGLSRVIYVEPYPKSQAYELFRDSIVLDDLLEERDQHDGTRVRFSPFSGVGARRFIDLFSLGLSSGYKLKRKRDGLKIEWKRESGRLRVPMLPNSYLDREGLAINELIALMKEHHELRREEPEHGRDAEVLGSRREEGGGGGEMAGLEEGGDRHRRS